jgi:hypothetical protein
MQLKATPPRSYFTSQRCLKFSERGNRKPIQAEDQKRLTLAVQKISNIFG